MKIDLLSFLKVDAESLLRRLLNEKNIRLSVCRNDAEKIDVQDRDEIINAFEAIRDIVVDTDSFIPASEGKMSAYIFTFAGDEDYCFCFCNDGLLYRNQIYEIAGYEKLKVLFFV